MTVTHVHRPARVRPGPAGLAWALILLGGSLIVWLDQLGYTNYGLLARPGALPAAAHVAATTAGVTVPMAVGISLIPLFAPAGLLPSPRWRRWARVSVAAAALGLLAWVPLPFDGPYRLIPNPLAVPAALAGPGDASWMEAV